MSRGGPRTPGRPGRPTKAMILAAGQGLRLRPHTERTPKCMIPIGEKPLLEYTVEWLRSYGVTDLIINLCHRPEVVINHFGDGGKWRMKITYSLETAPLGTAGSVRKVEKAFTQPFFVWYGDNLSTCDLDRLYVFHCAKGGMATVALYFREDPAQSGRVDLDAKDRVVRFLEKPPPDQAPPCWVNAGIYVLTPAVLEVIPLEGSPDFGRDVFPTLLALDAPVYGYKMSAHEGLWWIDTPEDLSRVRAEWQGRRLRTLSPPCSRQDTPEG